MDASRWHDGSILISAPTPSVCVSHAIQEEPDDMDPRNHGMRRVPHPVVGGTSTNTYLSDTASGPQAKQMRKSGLCSWILCGADELARCICVDQLALSPFSCSMYV
jgi:hypothetical protein